MTNIFRKGPPAIESGPFTQSGEAAEQSMPIEKALHVEPTNGAHGAPSSPRSQDRQSFLKPKKSKKKTKRNARTRPPQPAWDLPAEYGHLEDPPPPPPTLHMKLHMGMSPNRCRKVVDVRREREKRINDAVSAPGPLGIGLCHDDVEHQHHHHQHSRLRGMFVDKLPHNSRVGLDWDPNSETEWHRFYLQPCQHEPVAPWDFQRREWTTEAASEDAPMIGGLKRTRCRKGPQVAMAVEKAHMLIDALDLVPPSRKRKLGSDEKQGGGGAVTVENGTGNRGDETTLVLAAAAKVDKVSKRPVKKVRFMSAIEDDVNISTKDDNYTVFRSSGVKIHPSGLLFGNGTRKTGRRSRRSKPPLFVWTVKDGDVVEEEFNPKAWRKEYKKKQKIMKDKQQKKKKAKAEKAAMKQTVTINERSPNLQNHPEENHAILVGAKEW